MELFDSLSIAKYVPCFTAVISGLLSIGICPCLCVVVAAWLFSICREAAHFGGMAHDDGLASVPSPMALLKCPLTNVFLCRRTWELISDYLIYLTNIVEGNVGIVKVNIS